MLALWETFASARFGLLRLGLACARFAWAGMMRVAEAWVPLLIILLLCFRICGFGVASSRLGLCSFGVGCCNTSRGRMGTAADYVAAWFGFAGLGLLRLGLACAPLP